MAEESEQGKSIHELRQQIAHSRDRLGRDLTGMRYELNFPLKFRKSFQRRTVVWIAAAAVVGVVLTSMPRRTKKIYVNARGGGKGDGDKKKEGLLGAGVLLGVFKLAATVLRPVVIRMVTEKFGAARAGKGRSAAGW
jgi:hypothetical protein